MPRFAGRTLGSSASMPAEPEPDVTGAGGEVMPPITGMPLGTGSSMPASEPDLDVTTVLKDLRGKATEFFTRYQEAVARHDASQSMQLPAIVPNRSDTVLHALIRQHKQQIGDLHERYSKVCEASSLAAKENSSLRARLVQEESSREWIKDRIASLEQRTTEESEARAQREHQLETTVAELKASKSAIEVGCAALRDNCNDVQTSLKVTTDALVCEEREHATTRVALQAQLSATCAAHHRVEELDGTLHALQTELTTARANLAMKQQFWEQDVCMLSAELRLCEARISDLTKTLEASTQHAKVQVLALKTELQMDDDLHDEPGERNATHELVCKYQCPVTGPPEGSKSSADNAAAASVHHTPLPVLTDIGPSVECKNSHSSKCGGSAHCSPSHEAASPVKWSQPSPSAKTVAVLVGADDKRNHLQIDHAGARQPSHVHSPSIAMGLSLGRSHMPTSLCEAARACGLDNLLSSLMLPTPAALDLPSSVFPPRQLKPIHQSGPSPNPAVPWYRQLELSSTPARAVSSRALQQSPSTSATKGVKNLMRPTKSNYDTERKRRRRSDMAVSARHSDSRQHARLVLSNEELSQPIVEYDLFGIQ